MAPGASELLSLLAEGLAGSHGVAHKRDIEALIAPFLPEGAAEAAHTVLLGDDCGAIPDGDGWLLFAIEGFQTEFTEREPWFAGYCGVMVNVSDIYSMGGRPIAVVDAVWSHDTAHALVLMEGLAAGARVYQVPVVGGHSNARSSGEQLAVAILGRARRLITSFDAEPGDVLIAAIDLRGRYREPSSNWDASTGSPAERLRADLEILPALAESGLCKAGKDISQASVIGTALMLLECSGLGGVIDVNAVPHPPGVALSRWLLSTFPSYGFLLSVNPAHAEAVLGHFGARGIESAVIGRCDRSGVLSLRDRGAERAVWDFAERGLMGCGPRWSANGETVDA